MKQQPSRPEKRKMAVVEKAGQVSFQEFDLAPPSPHEILLKTCYSAVCGSDLHLYHDIHPFIKAPCTIGHELSGRVVEIGSSVKGFALGDLVAPEPVLVCGSCSYCQKGDYHMCNDISYQYRRGQAGFADYFLVDARWAHKVPEAVGEKAAALIEPLSVAIHGVRKTGNLLAKSVAVIGAGPIGALAAHICQLEGASKIWLIDRNSKKLETATRLVTAAEGVNTAEKDAVETVLAATGGQGCDVVIECTGSEECAVHALNMAAKMGGILQMGISTRPFSQYPYARILQKEITLWGSQGYCFDFQRAIALLTAGKLNLQAYITHEFASRDIAKAFALAADPLTDSMKIILSYE